MAFGFSADIRSQSILTRLLAMLPYVSRTCIAKVVTGDTWKFRIIYFCSSDIGNKGKYEAGKVDVMSLDIHSEKYTKEYKKAIGYEIHYKAVTLRIRCKGSCGDIVWTIYRPTRRSDVSIEALTLDADSVKHGVYLALLNLISPTTLHSATSTPGCKRPTLMGEYRYGGYCRLAPRTTYVKCGGHKMKTSFPDVWIDIRHLSPCWNNLNGDGCRCRLEYSPDICHWLFQPTW